MHEYLLTLMIRAFVANLDNTLSKNSSKKIFTGFAFKYFQAGLKLLNN